MSDYTAARTGIFEFTEKKSRFIGVCCPVLSEEDAQAKIAALRKEHKSACHVVYAFSIGEHIRRSTDDGEPSGTAGRPVLEVITNSDLNNVIIMVVRYFGGTLLGTGGLVRAYTEAARGALAAAGRARSISCVRMLFTVDYAELPAFQQLLSATDVLTEDKSFGERASLRLLVPVSEREALCQKLAGTSAEYIVLDEDIISVMPV